MTVRITVLFVFVLISGASLSAAVTTTRPDPGIEYREEIRTNPPLHLHAVIVDLTDPRVHLRVCRGASDPKMTRTWETALMPVSEIARRDGLFAAVNGSYFIPKDFTWVWGRKFYYMPGNWARACGWTMSDGKLFSAQPASVDWPSLIVSKTGNVAIGNFQRFAEGAGQVVSGMYQLVTDGKNTAPPNDIKQSKPAPHTAVGYDHQHKKLILLVVDGRRPEYSAGMGVVALGDELIDLGCWDAILLDGGGSSTMVMRASTGAIKLMNRPSDGHDLPLDLSVERNVADAFGVEIDGATTKPASADN